ncbi:MAG: hypothetical protein JNM69_12795 [Archangium sp.]|nr:hypothetical protein [Archangium sp.]MBL8935425.1 hypothetical protein [Archangium sp.]
MRALFAGLVVAASLAFADIAPPEKAPPEPAPAPAVVEPAPAPAPAPQHPMGIEKAVGSGVIQGGWEYVYACYALAVIGVLGYGASLFVRRPKEQAS